MGNDNQLDRKEAESLFDHSKQTGSAVEDAGKISNAGMIRHPRSLNDMISKKKTFHL